MYIPVAGLNPAMMPCDPNEGYHCLTSMAPRFGTGVVVRIRGRNYFAFGMLGENRGWSLQGFFDTAAMVPVAQENLMGKQVSYILIHRVPVVKLQV